MTDDREVFKPEASPEDAGDPAAAFEALRRTIEKQGGQLGAEMTIIRRGVEAAFDQFEKYRQPPDYGPDLGKIIQFLAVVEERLEAVEQSPILRNGAEHYARALERSGEGLVRTAALELERRATDLEREAGNLADYTKSAYDRKSQDLRMWIAGGVGLLAGALLVLLLPRILPFAADTHVAATHGQERPASSLSAKDRFGAVSKPSGCGVASLDSWAKSGDDRLQTVDGHPELLDDGFIEIRFAYHNDDEAMLKAKRQPFSTAY